MEHGGEKFVKKLSLKMQLVLVTVVAIFVSILFMVLILPNLLKPFYEKNIYEILEQPLQFKFSEEQQISGGTATLICDFAGRVFVSNNFNKILKNTDVRTVMENITESYGKFKIDNNTYYYNTNQSNGQYFVTLCDDSYILEQEAALNRIVIPAIAFVAIIIILILVWYSNFIAKKIAGIKRKIDNIDNDNFKHNEEFELEDELNSLVRSIEKTRGALKEKEKYKNKMFQTLSHELKTPIMVISSHIEAMEDGVIEKDKGFEVVKNETQNLNQKLSLMLQLNKINYLKSSENFEIKEVQLNGIIEDLIDRLRVIRPDVEFKLELQDGVKFKGDKENWEIVFNNILTNFMRYADKEIVIRLNQNIIELQNDGEKIDDQMLDKIFDTYTMGNKGKTGLGLAIVKQTLDLFGYKIKAENLNNGVIFVIE